MALALLAPAARISCTTRLLSAFAATACLVLMASSCDHIAAVLIAGPSWANRAPAAKQPQQKVRVNVRGTEGTNIGRFFLFRAFAEGTRRTFINHKSYVSSLASLQDFFLKPGHFCRRLGFLVGESVEVEQPVYYIERKLFFQRLSVDCGIRLRGVGADHDLAVVKGDHVRWPLDVHELPMHIGNAFIRHNGDLDLLKLAQGTAPPRKPVETFSETAAGKRFEPAKGKLHARLAIAERNLHLREQTRNGETGSNRQPAHAAETGGTSTRSCTPLAMALPDCWPSRG